MRPLSKTQRPLVGLADDLGPGCTEEQALPRLYREPRAVPYPLIAKTFEWPESMIARVAGQPSRRWERCLAKAKITLAGLYVGNPPRATAHPTVERL